MLDMGGLYTLGDKAYDILIMASTILAVLVLAIYGIRFLLGNSAEKAKLKDHIWAYIAGFVIIYAAPRILEFCVTLLNNIKIVPVAG